MFTFYRKLSTSFPAMRAVRIATAITILSAAVFADSTTNLTRSVQQLADGIYTIRHKDSPDTFPQGNSTVIIGEREVLVVDSCYLPSSAREDIAEIRKWTNKPVRYLVNTHWHYDHTMGNGVYWDAFPGISIIAQTETAHQSIGYNPGWFERFPQRAGVMQKIIDAGKDNNGKVLTEGEKKEYRDAIAGLAAVQEEYKTLTDRGPTITYESEMDIDLGGRLVNLLHLGRANTAGDTVVYLPKEKLVLTGDIVVHPVPYMFGGYPFEFAKTLKSLDGLSFDTLVPGHGEVLRGAVARDYIHLLDSFLEDVTSEVDAQVHKIGPGTAKLPMVREAVMKNIDSAGWRKKFAGDSKTDADFFDTTLAAMITAADAEVSAR